MGYLCQLNPYLECDGCMLCYALDEREQQEKNDEEND